MFLSLATRWEQFDKNYLSKLLLRKSVYRKSELWEAYQKINIRDAISVIDQVGGGGFIRESPDRFVYDITVTSCHRGHVMCMQGGNVLTSARLSLPSMASRASFPEVTNVTNYL